MVNANFKNTNKNNIDEFFKSVMVLLQDGKKYDLKLSLTVKGEKRDA
jgi:hypothetical protein